MMVPSDAPIHNKTEILKIHEKMHFNIEFNFDNKLKYD